VELLSLCRSTVVVIARCCYCESPVQVSLWNSCLSAGRRLSSLPGIVVVRVLSRCHCGTLVSLQVARCCCRRCCRRDSAVHVSLWNSCFSAGRRLSSLPGVVVVRVMSMCHCGTLVSLQIARCCCRESPVHVSLWNSCLSAGRQVLSSLLL